MGWSFRRSKSFGLFRLNFSKSGVGFSVGVKGARIGAMPRERNMFEAASPALGFITSPHCRILRRVSRLNARQASRH